jgi:hypothetical protein
MRAAFADGKRAVAGKSAAGKRRSPTHGGIRNFVSRQVLMLR